MGRELCVVDVVFLDVHAEDVSRRSIYQYVHAGQGIGVPSGEQGFLVFWNMYRYVGNGDLRSSSPTFFSSQ